MPRLSDLIKVIIIFVYSSAHLLVWSFFFFVGIWRVLAATTAIILVAILLTLLLFLEILIKLLNFVVFFLPNRVHYFYFRFESSKCKDSAKTAATGRHQEGKGDVKQGIVIEEIACICQEHVSNSGSIRGLTVIIISRAHHTRMSKSSVEK